MAPGDVSMAWQLRKDNARQTDSQEGSCKIWSSGSLRQSRTKIAELQFRYRVLQLI